MKTKTKNLNQSFLLRNQRNFKIHYSVVTNSVLCILLTMYLSMCN